MHQAGWCVHVNVSAQVSELSSFFFKPSLFFIFPLFAALCVCDNSPAETKGEVLYRCCC